MRDEIINTEKQQLTTLQEVEENIAAGLTSNRIVSDPYQIDGPIQLMTREYLIHEQEVADGALIHIRPVPLLLAQETIIKYLSNFGLFRANVCLRIELVSNPMQYGLIEVSVLPEKTDTNYVNDSQLVQSNWLLLDIGEQESGELKIPFLRTKLYYTRGDADDWRVTLKAFVNVITTTTPGTIGVRVFAHFDNLELAMPLSPYSAVMKEAVFQSGPNRFENRARLKNIGKAVGGMLFTAGTTYLGTKLGMDFSGVAEQINAKEESAHVNSKMELLGDISTRGAKTASEKRLGDDMLSTTDLGGTAMDVYDIVQICKLPSLISGRYFSDVGTSAIYDPNPFNLLDSYPTFIGKMFRYWRGSMRLYLRFCCSPMVSARFLIVLYPDGDVSSGVDALGDMPNWVITVKGCLDWSLEIPYLQKETWQDLNVNPVYNPRIGVYVMGTLPQPFDMPVGIFVRAYCSMSDDLQFAALQSNATPDVLIGEAEFQSISNRMEGSIKLGASVPVRYMGYNGTVLDVMKRYSDTLVPTVENYYPYPKIPETQLIRNKTDNFDYLPSIYKWYSGDVRVKLVFAAGNTPDLLRVSIKNSKTPIPSGAPPVAGDSSAATTQAVWPVIDVVYPYMSVNPMNLLVDPEPIYGLHIPKYENLSQVLTSAAENFRLHYLMPVPSLPLTGEAVFQSYITPLQSKIAHTRTFTFNTATIETKDLPNIPEYLCSYELSVLVTDSGGGAAPFLFALYDANYPLSVPLDQPEHLSAVLQGCAISGTLYKTSGTAFVYGTSMQWGVYPIDSAFASCSLQAMLVLGPVGKGMTANVILQNPLSWNQAGSQVPEGVVTVQGYDGPGRVPVLTTDRKSVV